MTSDLLQKNADALMAEATRLIKDNCINLHLPNDGAVAERLVECLVAASVLKITQIIETMRSAQSNLKNEVQDAK
jgi:hypothetical protein